MCLEFGGGAIDGAAIVYPHGTAAPAGLDRNRRPVGPLIDKDIAARPEGDGAARGRDVTGILEEIGEENDIPVLTGDGTVVTDARARASLEAVRASVEEVSVVDVEGLHQHHAPDIDDPARSHKDTVGVDHGDTSVGSLESAVNRARIPRDDTVKSEGARALIDSGDLSRVDRERLPVDDGILGEVIDVENGSAESLEIHVPDDDLPAGWIRADLHRHEHETGRQEHNDQHLEQEAPAKFWREVFHIKKWGDEGGRGGSHLPALTT